MSLFEDFIYYSDWKNDYKIYRVHKFCSEKGVPCSPEAMTGSEKPNKPMGLVVVNPDRQPAIDNNPCPPGTCKEKEICLLRPDGMGGVSNICKCADHWEKDNNGVCESQCGAFDFTCKDGHCLPEWKVNDGKGIF